MALEEYLARNRAWAARMVAEDPRFFSRHVAGQNPRMLWIGCADSRVPAERILDCEPGEVFVHRNVANIVAYNDVNVAAVLQFALEELRIQDVVVCGHYGCGGIRAASDERVVGGYAGDWLMIASWAKLTVLERLAAEGKARPEEEEFQRLLVEENVRLQLHHLAMLSVIRSAWERQPGIPRLHGWVYDIHTGLLVVVGGASRERRG